MYWYMDANNTIPKYSTALYFVMQFIWMRCLLFSLFVAVLLVNFSVVDDDKMPRQKIKYDREEALAVTSGKKGGSALIRALNAGSMTDEVKVVKKTNLMIMQEYNVAQPLSMDPTDVEVRELEGEDNTRRSLNYFDVSDPFRLRCAKIEGHPWFDKIVMWMVISSCFVIAFESPELMEDYGFVFDIFNALMLLLFYVESFI